MKKKRPNKKRPHGSSEMIIVSSRRLEFFRLVPLRAEDRYFRDCAYIYSRCGTILEDLMGFYDNQLQALAFWRGMGQDRLRSQLDDQGLPEAIVGDAELLLRLALDTRDIEHKWIVIARCMRYPIHIVLIHFVFEIVRLERFAERSELSTYGDRRGRREIFRGPEIASQWYHLQLFKILQNRSEDFGTLFQGLYFRFRRLLVKVYGEFNPNLPERCYGQDEVLRFHERLLPVFKREGIGPERLGLSG